jgi:hypothetical protein
MLVRDLIKELQRFPNLSPVFVQSSDSDAIHRLDSTREIYIRVNEILTELHDDETPNNNEVIDYGVLIYG